MLETIKDNPVAATAIVASGAVLTIVLVKKINKRRREAEDISDTIRLIENIQLANAN